MITHNLLIIIRNINRSRSSFLINLLGLSTGLACALLIFLWVRDEMNMDKFHQAGDRLVEIMEHNRTGDEVGTTYSTPGLLAEKLASDQPDVEYAVVVTPPFWFDPFLLKHGEHQVSAVSVYASKDFFRMFSFELLEASDVLRDKHSIVLSASMARALFGEITEAIGRSIVVDNKESYIVSGVFRDTPTTSSMRFDAVFSFEKWKEITPQTLDWKNAGPMTFALLRPGISLAQFNTKIRDIISNEIGEKHRTPAAYPFNELYLNGNFNSSGKQAGGRIEFVVMFSLVGCFILIIACVNFMNLSTARASKRVKEVGIKKAVGAGRFTLITQFMIESMLISFLSLVVAVLLVDLLLPQFNVIAGKQLKLELSLGVVMTLLGIAATTGIISGSYPALYLSAFNPATVLKGKMHSSLGELWVRKGLVVFQFALSVIFIVAVVVVYRQIEYLRQKDIGYDRENMLYFHMKGKIMESREVFLNEVRNLPGVAGASSISQSLVGGGNTTDLKWEGKDPNQRSEFAIRIVNYDMLELLKMHLMEGRFPSRDYQDSLNVVVNESAARAMAMKEPVGSLVDLGPFQSKIIGVIKDYHYESLHTPIKPMFFIIAPSYTQKIMIRLAAGNPQPAIERIQQLHREFNPEFPFEFRFLDQDYNAQYFAEQRISVLSRYCASIAIIISCLGLFGLAAYTAERRFKEVGIRKVLGSSNLGIIYLLSSDFLKVVFMAVVIALPLSYFLLSGWLATFAFRIPLEWWYFAGAGFIALFVAWLTVASQAARASRVNPVNCLRSE